MCVSVLYGLQVHTHAFGLRLRVYVSVRVCVCVSVCQYASCSMHFPAEGEERGEGLLGNHFLHCDTHLFFSYFPSLLIFAVSTSFSEISSAVLASIRGRNSRCKQELRFGLRARGSAGRCRGPVNLATVSCKSDITHLSGVCVRGDKTFSYSLRLIHKLFFSV